VPVKGSWYHHVPWVWTYRVPSVVIFFGMLLSAWKHRKTVLHKVRNHHDRIMRIIIMIMTLR
jgi:heme exporter protein D